MNKLINYFKINERNTSIKNEVMAGITNYFTLIYIVLLVPEILIDSFSGAGSLYEENQIITIIYSDMTAGEVLVSLTAICFIVAGIASIILGVMVNLPLVQGPSIAISAFVTYTICNDFGYSYNQALAIVFLSGITFFILSITGLEQKIHDTIPNNIKYAVGAGIGLFIIVRGLFKAHILENTADGVEFFNIYNIHSYSAISGLLAIGGIVFIIILLKYNVHGAVLWGKILCTVLAIPLGLLHNESVAISNFNITPFLCKLDFTKLFDFGIAPVILIIFSLCVMDIFETISVYVAMDGFVDKKHLYVDQKRLPKILEVDSITTSLGSLLGATNVSTYTESVAGIVEGGRTGLTAVVTGLLFLLSLMLTPLISIVVPAATATTLIMAGILMLQVVKRIDFKDISESAPAIITMILMPLTDSILVGIAFGIIIYCLTHLFLPQSKKASLPLCILSILFVIMLILFSK